MRNLLTLTYSPDDVREMLRQQQVSHSAQELAGQIGITENELRRTCRGDIIPGIRVARYFHLDAHFSRDFGGGN